jgi:hypothetical protein
MDGSSFFNFNAHKHSGVGILVVLLWLVLFGMGMLIDSKPYRDALTTKNDTLRKDTVRITITKTLNPDKVQKIDTVRKSVPFLNLNKRPVMELFCNVIIFWTPTNVALLSMLAGLAGGFSRKIWRKPNSAANATTPKMIGDDIDFYNTSPFSGMIVGFVVYLAFISGTFLTMDNPFTNPTQGQYIRTAGFISLFGFAAAYEPTIFINILSYLTSLKKPGDGGKSGN